MIEKYTNEHGKECYRGVEIDTPMADLLFHEVDGSTREHCQLALHTDIGSITVLKRMTGFGWWDTESGYRAMDGEFWLASGNYDVRYSNVLTFGDAVLSVKGAANTCIGNEAP